MPTGQFFMNASFMRHILAVRAGNHLRTSFQRDIIPLCSFQPSYNLAPGHDAPVVLPGGVGERDVQTMR